MSLNGSIKDLSHQIQGTQKLLEALAVALENIQKEKAPLESVVGENYVPKIVLVALAVEGGDPHKFHLAREKRTIYNRNIGRYCDLQAEYNELKRLEKALSENIEDSANKIRFAELKAKHTPVVAAKLLNHLEYTTHCHWEKDPASTAGHERVRSQPLNEDDAKTLAKLLKDHGFGECGCSFFKSPRGNYYRVFMNQKPTIDVFVNNELGGVYRTPLEEYFDGFEPQPIDRSDRNTSRNL